MGGTDTDSKANKNVGEKKDRDARLVRITIVTSLRFRFNTTGALLLNTDHASLQRITRLSSMDAHARASMQADQVY